MLDLVLHDGAPVLQVLCPGGGLGQQPLQPLRPLVAGLAHGQGLVQRLLESVHTGVGVLLGAELAEGLAPGAEQLVQLLLRVCQPGMLVRFVVLEPRQGALRLTLARLGLPQLLLQGGDLLLGPLPAEGGVMGHRRQGKPAGK